MKAILSIAVVVLLATPFVVMLCSNILLLNIASVFYGICAVEAFLHFAPKWMKDFYEDIAKDY